MATNSDRNSDGTRWEGYANYQEVSSRLSQSVDDAIAAYSVIQGLHSERPAEGGFRETAAMAKADILNAAMALVVEMKEEQARGVDDYDEILERWTGEEDDDSPAYMRQIHGVNLHDGVPGWLYQFVLDIRTAAFRLGYLQAGRREKQRPDDPVEAEVEAMFEGM